MNAPSATDLFVFGGVTLGAVVLGWYGLKYLDEKVSTPDARVLQGKHPYLLGNKLGQGGFGAVYKATDLDTGEAVAVKVLHAHGADPTTRALFAQEARLGKKIPGAVKVLDYQDGREPFLVMELLKGETLWDAYKHDHLTEDGKIVAIAETLMTLGKAHKQGVVHRDIKPDNLWLDEDGSLKVLDLGLAEAPGGPRYPKGTAIGTPGYMSPEQALGKKTRASADVFSTGATAYTILGNKMAVDPHGEPPITCPVVPLEDVNPAVPLEIAHVIDRSLACDPKARYKNANQMFDALAPAVRTALERELSRG